MLSKVQYPQRLIGLYINYPQILELALSQSHLPGENAVQFYAGVALRTVPIFVPPGTHYCRVTRGGVDLKACPRLLHMTSTVGIELPMP